MSNNPSTFMLVGPQKSGKTTFFNTLIGLSKDEQHEEIMNEQTLQSIEINQNITEVTFEPE